jgi:hypothetical protein
MVSSFFSAPISLSEFQVLERAAAAALWIFREVHGPNARSEGCGAPHEP